MRKILHYIGRLLTTNNFNIKSAFKVMYDRNWDKIYLFCDIHGTILEPDYGKVAKKYYPNAKKTLQYLTKNNKVKLILYTCSYEHEINEYVELFESDGIIFDYINENPEAENTRGGCFDKKSYFNILLEDKAGFIGDYDWLIVYYLIKFHSKFY